ncbi:MAG: valine--tRNA ligase [Actinomycetota bacterium]|nr:valine--tRNA ligase [Actinomycetota bacterium]
MTSVPERPNLDGLEERWSEEWEAAGTFRFDRTATRDRVFSIDTPPPTVSGSLHIGHIFSYTHTDCVARYRRMAGEEVFYPMGWDDNGLPTERRVQNYYGVTCDPNLPYDPDFVPPEKPEKRSIPISRPNFVELCRLLTLEDEQVFERVWRKLGLSVDWSMTYATIDKVSQRTSQMAFLRMLERGEAYQAEAPTIWDVSFQSAVAQAEIEEKELPGAFHRIPFRFSDGSGQVEIETTRPELLPACVALVAHPEDERYRPHFGTTVTTPLFGSPVQIRPHELADPEKGSGIAMICTFGDTTDVTWWRELALGVRPVIDRRGRFVEIEWGSEGWESADPEAAQANYDELLGKTVKQAQKRIVEQLIEQGLLVGDPRPINHMVKFFEKGDRPLEIVTSRQWYIRNGGRDDDIRERLLKRGAQLVWHPPYMLNRYEGWVGGLNGDWLISRQRYFGVPFPVWYGVDDNGDPDYSKRHTPAEDLLPIDPSTDSPVGFDESQRDQPGGFTGDPDVMDTWATSSVSPQIISGWADDSDLFDRVFPMDLRPQAHDIIRTWLFSSVVRADAEHDSLPWTHAAISGWVLDPDRKKMSKSKGNVVTPLPLLERFGSDAVRYWAANGRPGTDTAVDEGQMKVGRRLAIKILNVSKFVLGLAGDEAWNGEVTEAIDRAMLAQLADVVAVTTEAFESFDYARAIEKSEAFFWPFCDNYVELVKGRAYGTGSEAAVASARRSLVEALSTLQRLFAPHLCFVTEEVWSWWQPGSVHRQCWPEADELRALAGEGDPGVFTVTAEVLGEVRRAKTEAKRSLRVEAEAVQVFDTPDRLALIEPARADLMEAGRISDLVCTESESASVDVTLSPED